MSPLFFSLATLTLGVLVVVLGVLFAGAADDARPASRSKSCDNCGASVFDDWRLCPDCGERIECAGPDAEIAQ